MSNVSNLAKPSRTTRSRVTNGSTLHLGAVDGRTEAARRFRDVLGQIVADLGGADLLSEGQRQLARRAAMLSVEAERMEASAVAGDAFDLDAFGSLSDRLGRCFNRIGLQRRSRDVTPNLRDYIAAHAEREAGG